MGVRGEIFSTRMICEGRTYFFNVKQNRMGDLYLAIVESKPTETESFDRRSIVIFKENLGEFLPAFEQAIEALKKMPAPSHRGGHADPRDPDDPTLGRPRPRAATPRPASADRHGSRDTDARPRRAEAGSTKTRILRARKTAIPAGTGERPAAKPPARRLTVKKAKPRDEG